MHPPVKWTSVLHHCFDNSIVLQSLSNSNKLLNKIQQLFLFKIKNLIIFSNNYFKNICWKIVETHLFRGCETSENKEKNLKKGLKLHWKGWVICILESLDCHLDFVGTILQVVVCLVLELAQVALEESLAGQNEPCSIAYRFRCCLTSNNKCIARNSAYIQRLFSRFRHSTPQLKSSSLHVFKTRSMNWHLDLGQPHLL